MAWRGNQICQQRHDRGRRTGRIWITGMTENANHPILNERTTCPSALASGRKPDMRSFMQNVRRVHQRDQNVNVQQKARGQESSSRNSFTRSVVTGRDPRRTGRRGTPLRSRRRVCGGCNA